MTTRSFVPAAAPRGFSLIEMMVVVAIISVISSLGVASVVNITRTGRVNGTSTVLARMMANARTRAVVERCPYLVQIGGQRWSPTGAVNGQHILKRGVVVYRKLDCLSTNGVFEAGDQYIQEFSMDDSTGRVTLAVAPAGVVPNNWLDLTGLTIAYSPTGVRSIFVDPANSGTFVADTVVPANANLDITVVPWGTAIPIPPQTTQRVVNIPAAGPAKAP
jgi:prepilin-type N-terminal cleavage/methylation domain-containing protein